MSKVLFEIKYSIYPEKRIDYLQCIDEIKSLIKGDNENRYYVFESEKTPNNFTEIFLVDSEEKLEEIESNYDERTKELISKLFEEYIIDKKVTYTTKFEI